MPKSKCMYWFNTGVYDMSVGFTTHPDVYARLMKKHKVTEYDVFSPPNKGCLHSFYDENKRLLCVITLTASSKTNRSITPSIASIIGHEATHTKQAIAEYIEEASLSSEAEAYLIDFIIKHCLQAYLDGY